MQSSTELRARTRHAKYCVAKCDDSVSETLATPTALKHLARRRSHESETVRGQAVHALWRASRFPERFDLDPAIIGGVVDEELDRLGRLVFLSALLSIQDSNVWSLYVAKSPSFRKRRTPRIPTTWYCYQPRRD